MNLLYLKLQKREIWVLGALLAGAAAAILALKPTLAAEGHALSPRTAALFIPFAAGSACLLYLHVSRGRLGRTALAPVIVCLLLSALMLDVFHQPVEHYQGDDPARYSVYAHNILDRGTLWGSSGELHGAGKRYFVDQPGYRYYLAGMIWLSGGENRLMQLLNLLLLLAVLTVAVDSLKRRDTPLAWFTALVLILAAPYAAKNVVQGLSEWLAVSLMVLYAAALLRGRHVPALILLALAPFVRQNLLPAAAALAGIQVVVTRRYGTAVPFILVLLLPLYHNLYYAGALKLLVENKGAMLDPSAPLHETASLAMQIIPGKLGSYLGIPNGQADLHTIVAALLFAPVSLAGILYFVLYRPVAPAWLCLGLLILTIGPTLIFGHAYYPRFVYTNYAVGFLGLVALEYLVSRRPG